jgi:preprotein translocase subunit Sec63
MVRLNADDACALLGVTKNTPHDVIKKRWRKLALKHHPDREGGDHAKFSKLNEAYTVVTGRDAEVIKITEVVFEEVWDDFYSSLSAETQDEIREELEQLEREGD